MRALGIGLIILGVYIAIAVGISYTDDPNAFAKAMGALACVVVGAVLIDREKRRT